MDRGIDRAGSGAAGSTDPQAPASGQYRASDARPDGARRYAERTTIAHHCRRGQEDQAEVWKKYKPKKQDPQVTWWEIARALTKTRMLAKHASFGDDLAQAYGITWAEDLFAPADLGGGFDAVQG